jgi:hypothetical protein
VTRFGTAPFRYRRETDSSTFMLVEHTEFSSVKLGPVGESQFQLDTYPVRRPLQRWLILVTVALVVVVLARFCWVAWRRFGLQRQMTGDSSSETC